MFGKKKELKVKEPSAKEIALNQASSQLEQLSPGQTIIYRLPEIYRSSFGAFGVVELNPSYPENGRKYIVSTDKVTDDGKPAGQKRRIYDTDKAMDVARWIADKQGKLFS